ncbi:hypothetical protein ACET3Z_018844 [Daucus carota]
MEECRPLSNKSGSSLRLVEDPIPHGSPSIVKESLLGSIDILGSPHGSPATPNVEDASPLRIVWMGKLESSIMNALLKMKIKPKRGRPRSSKKVRQNKYLKVPKRRRSLKGPGLPKINAGKGADGRDEAQAIFETGVLMGLIPVNGMEESPALIRANLHD